MIKLQFYVYLLVATQPENGADVELKVLEVFNDARCI